MVAGIWLHLLLLFGTKVYLGNHPQGVSFPNSRVMPTRVSLESTKLLVAWGAIERGVEEWEVESNLELLRT